MKTNSIFSVAVLFLFGIVGAIRANDVVWTGGASGTSTAWLTGTNWSGGNVPGATDNAIFQAAGTANTIGINMNGSTNNGPNNQAVGAIVLDATNARDRIIKNSSLTADGTLTLNGNGGTLLSNQSAFTLTVSTGPDKALNVTLGNSGNINALGPIMMVTSISGVGSGITLNGPGTVTMLGANSYTGGTSVTNGTLLLNAPNGSGTGTGSVVVSGAGTVGGTGSISMASNQRVTIQSGGTISPTPVFTFQSPFLINGTQTSASLAYTSTLNVQTGATFRFTLSSATNFSQLGLTGTIDITGSTVAVAVDSGFAPNVGSSFLVVQNDGADAITGIFAQGATVIGSDGQIFSIAYNGGDGNDLVLTTLTAAVPEPAIYMLLGLGALVCAQQYRRRRKA